MILSIYGLQKPSCIIEARQLLWWIGPEADGGFWLHSSSLILHMLGGIAWASSDSWSLFLLMFTVLVLRAEQCIHLHVCVCRRWFVCLGFQKLSELQHPKKKKKQPFLSTWYQSQLYLVACKREWKTISKGEQGLEKRQQTAVDSNVFPIILQSHFEDRLSWTNSGWRLKCTKVPMDKKRPNAPEVKQSFNQVASIIVRRFPKWLLLLGWSHQFCCQVCSILSHDCYDMWSIIQLIPPSYIYQLCTAHTTSSNSSHIQLIFRRGNGALVQLSLSKCCVCDHTPHSWTLWWFPCWFLLRTDAIAWSTHHRISTNPYC